MEKKMKAERASSVDTKPAKPGGSVAIATCFNDSKDEAEKSKYVQVHLLGAADSTVSGSLRTAGSGGKS
jgi:hypothetical protein